MSENQQIILRPRKQGTFLAHHPWILSHSIIEPDNPPQAGDVVDLVLPDGHWISRGIYNPNSRIRVRMYTWDRNDTLDSDFIVRRLNAAIHLRRGLSNGSPLEAQRLVFSEADQLSGLIVDRYANYLVIQVTAAAMLQFLPSIVDCLVSHFHPRGILLQMDEKTAKAEGVEPQQRVIFGDAPDQPVEIEENGVRLQLDLIDGQKTGYYLDQRDNRRRAADWVAPGGRVLDVCCYVGGFSLAIAKWSSAREVVGLDTSAKAIASARNHAELNKITNARFVTGDFFDQLEVWAKSGEQFDLIVLDPPRFASARSQVEQALRAYHRLNALALRLMRPGGILITCSCSGRVTREDFRHMLIGVSQRTGRDLQVLEQRSAAADHPYLLACPETDYLKCFVCRVM